MLLLALYTVQVSDSVSGKAPRRLKEEIVQAFKGEIRGSGRLQLAQPAKLLAFLSADADSSRKVFNIKELKKNPILREFLPEGKEEDTLYFYSIWLEARFVDAESGEVVAAFKARGRGWGESWPGARRSALRELRGSVAKELREAFQLEARVKRVWGSPWTRRAEIELGSAKGLRKGEVFGLWRPLGPVRRRVGLGRVIKLRKGKAILSVEEGVWQVRPGDVAVEEPLVEDWGAEAYAVARAGELWSDSSLGFLRGFYLGVSHIFGLARWSLGLEGEARPPFRGARLWVGPRLELGLIPEYLYLEPGFKLGFAWHLQPVVDTSLGVETANSLGFALRPELGFAWRLGPDAALVAGAGWHLEWKSPWFAWREGEITSESGESSTETFDVPPEALQLGDAWPVGLTLWAGLRFVPW